LNSTQSGDRRDSPAVRAHLLDSGRRPTLRVWHWTADCHHNLKDLQPSEQRLAGVGPESHVTSSGRRPVLPPLVYCSIRYRTIFEIGFVWYFAQKEPN